jgi:hypothetical protein
MSSTVLPNPDVVDTEIADGELALLDLTSKTYFSLNRTGGRIWFHLKQGLSTEDICRRLQDEFAVSDAQARQSAERLIEDLIRHNLAQRS